MSQGSVYLTSIPGNTRLCSSHTGDASSQLNHLTGMSNYGSVTGADIVSIWHLYYSWPYANPIFPWNSPFRKTSISSPFCPCVMCLSQTGSVYFLWIRHIRLTPDNHLIKIDKVPLKLSRLTVIERSIRDNVWTLNVVLLDSDIFIFHWLECTTHLYMFIYSVFSINIYLCTCCTAWLWLVVELKN